ncbi:hypothetical protein C8J57DRAFT_1490244 [Mycena rebaudengoi]|nr:hypothetical protein C8J57DRAFT_1490244 [Mycena rebaudengoi]
MDTALLLANSTTAGFEKLLQEAETNVVRPEDLTCLREKEYSLRLALAPICQVPVELLREIFVLAIAHGPLTPDDVKRILRLTQVCAHWRHVAHNTPQLWTSPLLINLLKPSLAQIEGVKMWLERSAPLPVPIHVDLPLDSSLGREWVGTLVWALLSAAQRWNSLTFAAQSLRSLPRIPAGTFEQLEVLDLSCTAADLDAPVDSFLSAPRLRSVDLQIPQVESFLVLWAQLTVLKLSKVAVQTASDILAQCTSVVSATLCISDIPMPPNQPTAAHTAVTLPHCTKLDLDLFCGDGDYAIPILQRFMLPALHTLAVRFRLDAVNWPGATLAQFLENSPAVAVIEICASTLDEEDLCGVLEKAPNLVRLALDDCWQCVGNEFFDALCYSTSTAPLAKDLNELYLGFVGTGFDETRLEAMLDSRWWSDAALLAMPTQPGVARWKSVTYLSGASGEDFDEDFQARMNVYRSQGLKLDLTR